MTSKTSEIHSQVFESDFFCGYDDLVLGRELRSLGGTTPRFLSTS